jgi:hypothetical protein
MLCFIIHLLMKVLLHLSSGMIGQYVRDVKHTDRQEHTTAVSVSVAFEGWIIIVLGELQSLKQTVTYVLSFTE